MTTQTNADYSGALDYVEKFLDEVPDQGLHQKALRILINYCNKSLLHLPFSREELNHIQRRADKLISNNELSPKWEKAYRDLSYSCSVLDAFNARSALPKGTVVDAPEQLDPLKMLSKLNLGQFHLEIWEHGMFVIWTEENIEHQKWIDFAKIN